jgi:hypothetical protein
VGQFLLLGPEDSYKGMNLKIHQHGADFVDRVKKPERIATYTGYFRGVLVNKRPVLIRSFHSGGSSSGSNSY